MRLSASSADAERTHAMTIGSVVYWSTTSTGIPRSRSMTPHMLSNAAPTTGSTAPRKPRSATTRVGSRCSNDERVRGERQQIALDGAEQHLCFKERVGNGSAGGSWGRIPEPSRGRGAADCAVGRFVSDESAERGRNPHGPATVGCAGERSQTRGERRRRSSRRSTWRALDVPRIPGRTVEQVGGERLVAEGRGVGLAHDNGTGSAIAGRDRIIDRVRAGVLVEMTSEAGRHAGGACEVLDEYRNASERPVVPVLGVAPSELGVHRDDGVQLGIKPLDSAQTLVDEFDRADTFGTDGCSEFPKRSPARYTTIQAARYRPGSTSITRPSRRNRARCWATVRCSTWSANVSTTPGRYAKRSRPCRQSAGVRKGTRAS